MLHTEDAPKHAERKKAFWAKYNGENIKVLAKYIPKKTCWAKNNREKQHFGQNTMEKT